jgi:hypothetical protein
MVMLFAQSTPYEAVIAASILAARKLVQYDSCEARACHGERDRRCSAMG